MNTGTHAHGEILLYEGEGDGLRIQVRIEHETVWLTKVQLAELLGTTKANISIYTKIIFGRVSSLKRQLLRNT